MLKSRLLRIAIITLIAMTIFMTVTEARLMAGGPEIVISNSTLILTGKVIESNETEEERAFTVLVNRVLKGEYSEAEIVFTSKKNPVYGWMGNIRTIPEVNTELLLFLRNDNSDNPYFAFDLNCIAIIEGQQVTSILDGSKVGINDEHWSIEDYIKAYNDFLHNIEPVSVRTEPASTSAEHDEIQDLSSPSRAVATSFFLPGITAFLVLCGLSLAGLWYYVRSKQRSIPFWIFGIVFCVVISYIIATFALTPLLLGRPSSPFDGETLEPAQQFYPPAEEEEDTAVSSKDNLVQIYSLALDSFMPLDEGLNHDMKYIAIDTTTMTDITEEGRKQILDFFKKYGVEVMDASLEKLKEEGLFDENKLCLEGILLKIESLEFESGDRVVIEGSKYRSAIGAIGVVSTLIYKDGTWQLLEANITWIS